MNNNSQNFSPERKGHLHKLSAEQLEAIIKARQAVRWEAYAEMYKAQGTVSEVRPNQPELIQNVAGVAIANESIQKTSPYPEIQPMSAERTAPVAQVAMTETAVSMPSSAAVTSESNPLLQQAAPSVATDPVAAAEQVVREAYEAMQQAGVQ